jgi:hypothetical protein
LAGYRSSMSRIIFTFVVLGRSMSVVFGCSLFCGFSVDALDVPPLRACWIDRRGRGAPAFVWSRSDFAMHHSFAPFRLPQVRRRRRKRIALRSRSESFRPVQFHNRGLKICRNLMPWRRQQRCPAYRVGFAFWNSRLPKSTHTPIFGLLYILISLASLYFSLRPVLWTQKATSSVKNIVGVWDCESKFPSQFVLPTPEHRADLHVVVLFQQILIPRNQVV